jgi:sugar lactone lactonase YvrE
MKPNTILSLFAITLAATLLASPISVQAQPIFTNSKATLSGASVNEASAGGSVTSFATVAGASSITGLTFDSHGDLFLVATSVVSSNIVRSIDEISPLGTVSTYAAVPSANDPVDLAFDSAGNLYAADGVNHQIIQIAPNGTVTTYATLPTGTLGAQALAFDSAGNLFIGDSAEIGPNLVGQVSEVAPGGGAANVIATLASLPGDLAFNSAGNLFVSNGTGPSSIVSEITPSGPTTYAMFAAGANPDGIAFGADGTLYVAGANELYDVAPGGGAGSGLARIVSVSSIAIDSVPEPSTWALMLGGMGLIAFLRLRTRRA